MEETVASVDASSPRHEGEVSRVVSVGGFGWSRALKYAALAMVYGEERRKMPALFVYLCRENA
jgi:hypothetical protein